MKCPKCNAEIADGSLFCTECGAKIENNANQETVRTEQNSAAKPRADAIRFNGNFYKVYYEDDVTWTEAKEACEALGGHLVTITSQDEQDFIESIKEDNDCLWIGLYRYDGEDEQWYWVTGESVDYENWADGKPDNTSYIVSNETCAVMEPKEWNDIADANTVEQSGYICEWEYQRKLYMIILK